MDFRLLLHNDDRTGLDRWFKECGELFVALYSPHSGGGSDFYILRSVAELDHVIESAPCREVELCVYRGFPFPYRGAATAELAATAVDGLPDNEKYAIVSLERGFPDICEFLGETDSKPELARLVTEHGGKHVGIGLDPCAGERANPQWLMLRPERVFYLAVKRNRNNWLHNP
jgi:hypothetical protein